MKRVLVIAAHPDDEIFGVGGTIIKHIDNGDNVYLLIITDGVSATHMKNGKELSLLRKENCKSAGDSLLINEVIFKDFPDAKLDTIPQLEINKVLEKEIDRINPDVIYTHSEKDLHEDHKIVNKATIIATRRKRIDLYCYEIIGSTIGFNPNFYVDISNELSYKLKVARVYKDLLNEFPHPISLEALKILARYRGIESGLNAAEAFECIRRFE